MPGPAAIRRMAPGLGNTSELGASTAAHRYNPRPWAPRCGHTSGGSDLGPAMDDTPSRRPQTPKLVCTLGRPQLRPDMGLHGSASEEALTPYVSCTVTVVMACPATPPFPGTPHFSRICIAEPSLAPLAVLMLFFARGSAGRISEATVDTSRISPKYAASGLHCVLVRPPVASFWNIPNSEIVYFCAFSCVPMRCTWVYEAWSVLPSGAPRCRNLSRRTPRTENITPRGP